MKTRLAAIASADAAAWSSQVCSRIVAWDLFRNAPAVMLFVPLPGEVDLRPLGSEARRLGKTLCLPRTDWAAHRIVPVAADLQRLVPGRYGLSEPPADAPPFPVSGIGLVLVPGLAFDLAGGRLGRGAGFYDQFLADPALKAATCAAAFDIQVVDSVPVTPRDIPIQWVATPTRLLAAKAAGADNP